MKDLIADKPITYRFKGSQISVLPYFLYEVSVDKHWKNGYCNLKSRYFKSNRFLKITEEVKHYDEYSIIRRIILLGAPYSFIKENNLSVYELYTKKVQKCQKRKK